MNVRKMWRYVLPVSLGVIAAVAIGTGSNATAAAGTKPLKIGIVGTGNIGGALATHWAKAGHELLLSSRHPEELQALAKSLGAGVRVGTPVYVKLQTAADLRKALGLPPQ